MHVRKQNRLRKSWKKKLKKLKKMALYQMSYGRMVESFCSIALSGRRVLL